MENYAKAGMSSTIDWNVPLSIEKFTCKTIYNTLLNHQHFPPPTAMRRLTEYRFIFQETIIFNPLTSWTFSTFQSLQCFSRRMVQNIKNKYKKELYLLKSSWSNPNWFQFTHWRESSQFPKSSIQVVIYQYTNSTKEI